ncbi:MAG TPA: fructosamine kinase family protein, partial [Bacteroidia bacterium]|nr:fructosamine kinase family protein [Bacteroidia bacterium]
MLNDKWLASALPHLLGGQAYITAIQPVSGGSINRAFSVDTTRGNYFVKVNSATRSPNIFETEAKGLELLAGVPSGLKIPGVIGTYSENGISCIVMENLTSGKETKSYWISLGRGLASLHKNTSDYFGLEYNNYIGSLPQLNTKHSSWTEFYINCRLMPQFEMACSLLASLKLPFENLCSKLPEVLPNEPPSLLHGDLWSGNCMAAA